jgi:hypothetical protein
MGTEGLEPSRLLQQRILSPSCLPISPHSLIVIYIVPEKHSECKIRILTVPKLTYQNKIFFNKINFCYKATPRFELGIEDLQSTALPLGHIALYLL